MLVSVVLTSIIIGHLLFAGTLTVLCGCGVAVQVHARTCVLGVHGSPPPVKAGQMWGHCHAVSINRPCSHKEI